MTRRLRLLALVSVVMYSFYLSATAQQGDVLVLNGKTYYIQTNPLRPFLEKHPDSIPKSNVISSANWRGYVASWEVKGGQLVLADITILESVDKPAKQGLTTRDISVLARVFPKQKEVLAEWFSGHIIVPDGKIVNYVHMGYASSFENYIVLRVEKVEVIRQWNMNLEEFKQFRDTQFAAFKRTQEFQKALNELNLDKGEPGLTRKQNEEFLREISSEEYMSMIFEEQK